MSTAVLEPIVEKTVSSQPVKLDLVAAAPAASREKEFADPHPLLPVFAAGVIALVLAGAFVGTIVIGLLLRNSGVLAQ
jgi:hypothetical protein